MLDALKDIIGINSISLWIYWIGFFLMGIGTLFNILVLFRKKLLIEQLSEPPEISGVWDLLMREKQRYLKLAYVFLGVGLGVEIFGMFTNLIL